MPAAQFSDRQLRALRAWLLVGIAIRVGYWLSKWNQSLLFNDSVYYSGQAYQLVNGRWFRELFVDLPGAEHGPLTSTLMAAFTWGDNYVRWQRLVTVLCGITLVWLLGRLAARIAGPRAGVVATAAAAISPNLWMNDGLIMSESISMLLVAATLWFALDAVERGDRRSLLLLGAMLGLGTLARSELALLAPLVLLWLGIDRRRRGLPFIPVLVPVAAIAGLVVLPWVAFNLARFERMVLLTTNEAPAWLGANCPESYHGDGVGGWSLLCVVGDPEYRTDEEASVRSARQRALAVQYVRNNLEDVPRVVAARVGRVLDLYGLNDLIKQDVGEERPRWAAWAGVVTFWPIAIAAAVGARQLRRRTRWLLLLPVVVVATTTVLVYGGHRIRSSAEPTLIILAAVAVTAAVEARRYCSAAHRSERPST